MGIFIWIIKGEIIEIEEKRIKVVTEKGKKYLILKGKKYNKFDGNKLELKIGDEIEARITSMDKDPMQYAAEWISKVIMSGSRKVSKTITLHPDYSDPILLDNYYDGIKGYRGRIKKIQRNGILVFPDGLTGHPGPDILILKCNGNYTFDFNKLALQVNDKVEALITEVKKEFEIVKARWIIRAGERDRMDMILSDPYLD